MADSALGTVLSQTTSLCNDLKHSLKEAVQNLLSWTLRNAAQGVDGLMDELEGVYIGARSRKLEGHPNRTMIMGVNDIRAYESTDIDDICLLYETVTGISRSEKWISWKFTQSPYADDIAIFVAERDDRIVGIRPYHLVPLRIGDDTLTAGYLQNVMVHPDYRGEGVFSRLSQHAINHLDGRASLLFCLANQNSRPIYTHWGWSAVTTPQTYYRPQNLTPLAAIYRDNQLTRWGGWIGTAVTRGILSICDRISQQNGALSIEHESEVPATQLAALYRRRIPENLHIQHDEAFYRWRFESSTGQVETYIAKRNKKPIAAAVTHTRTGVGGFTRTYIADIVLMLGERSVLSTLLQQVVRKNQNSDIIAATDTTLSPCMLIKNGFLPNNAPGLSLLHTGHMLFVRALDDIDISFEDESIWSLPLAIRDMN